MAGVEFRLPDVGEGIDGAELLEWKVAVGDRVREDQPLADVETDKAIVTLPSPADGVIAQLCFAAGDRVPVGEVLTVITTEAAIAAAPASVDGARASADGAATPLPHRPLASPATRRRARELGIDLATVTGSGPHGRIRRGDLEDRPAGGVTSEAALPASPPAPAARPAPGVAAESTTVPLRGIRRTIAHRLTESWQTIPHITDYRELDATALVAARQALRDRAARAGDEQLAKALTMTPIIVKAVCRALAENPYANASVDLERDELTLHGAINVGIAISAPDGLMVPVLHGADRLSLADTARAITELAVAARARRLTPEQLRGGTITVNNFGALGTWLGTPIIQPPQVVNLGIGRMDRRPVVRGEAIVIRPIVPLSASGDHRVLDGDTLAAFVNRVIELLEEPVLLLEGGC
jgi:pyruvate/2-oxoglutarate dehydrogenase complex dihydrolipoamide acyltransferase (E2) component